MRRDDLHRGVVRVQVETDDESWGITRRSRDDGLLGTTFQESGCLWSWWGGGGCINNCPRGGGGFVNIYLKDSYSK